MYYYITKILVSAVLIVLISEISKRSSLLGAILASIPLLSVIAIFWLYFETKDAEKIATLSKDIFWLVLPSLSLFIVLPILLRAKVNFYVSMLVSCSVMVVLYFIMLWLLRKFGVNI